MKPLAVVSAPHYLYTATAGDGHRNRYAGTTELRLPVLQQVTLDLSGRYDDYKRALDDKSVQAVYVATPSHKHFQIIKDAIAAGKHVYCEMPLASELEEAKAIAATEFMVSQFQTGQAD